MSIQDRKKDHIKLCLNEDVSYRTATGFDQFYFRHNALPEINPEDVSVESTLLGRTFSFPLFISSMTGGYTEAGQLNAQIARFCENNNLPFGVGSQRALIDHPEEKNSFAVVRDEAPTAFIAANIGGSQLVGGLSDENIDLLVETIRADAIIVHLNPLQELVQPEGDRHFKGIEEGIRQLIVSAGKPVVVKETGAGISGEVARRLLAAGVSVIDVAGAGGTSWAKVENLRKKQPDNTSLFGDWGIPTVVCIDEVVSLQEEFQFELIASGGIRGAEDVVKAHALGANFTAMARPVLQALHEGGTDLLQEKFEMWKYQTRLILTLLGNRTLKLCSKKDLLKK